MPEVTVSDLLKLHHEEAQEMQRQSVKAFESLNAQLGVVNGCLLTQGALGSVSEFTGKENFYEWIQEIEKCRKIHGLNENNTCQLVWAKTKGTVSQLVGRILKQTPDTTFSQLKGVLEREYGNIIDKQQAFIQLTTVRQGTNENVTSYVERLLCKADRAYGDNWRNDPRDFIEDQLVSIFMEGLRSHEIKTKIYQQNVREIDEAIRIAKSYDLCKKRFPTTFSQTHRNEPMVQGRQRNEMPMEVDHSRRLACYNCGGPHRQRECRERSVRQKKVHVVENQRRGQDTRRNWTKEEDRKYRRCYICHQVGHFAAQCRQKYLN